MSAIFMMSSTETLAERMWRIAMARDTHTSINLAPSEKELLANLAEELQLTQSDVIRNALWVYAKVVQDMRAGERERTSP